MLNKTYLLETFCVERVYWILDEFFIRFQSEFSVIVGTRWKLEGGGGYTSCSFPTSYQRLLCFLYKALCFFRINFDSLQKFFMRPFRISEMLN